MIKDAETNLIDELRALLVGRAIKTVSSHGPGILTLTLSDGSSTIITGVFKVETVQAKHVEVWWDSNSYI